MRLLRVFAAAAMAPVVVLVAWYLYDQFEVLGTADPSPWVRTVEFIALCVAVSIAHVIVLGARPTWCCAVSEPFGGGVR